ncbi:DUF1983 domain-containing protein [Citrobacter portucalensis]|uniref:host specificity protein J n=1 Tax=Citrobacter portucalensis TaxID=1639133 RepID=UPI0028BF32FC|nr:DUF1983 domain-containing protein [Citrobacter portucalensis]MDT7481051.1 DUF1983 domain-containing protein [Citrobacter portucalensis]
MASKKITGRKGGGSKSRTPTEQPDDLQSVAKAKLLVALGEGEYAGALTGKDIYLDGTPLENVDGSQNFGGVVWEFRAGTQAQNYIQGIPGTENEINVGTEISSATAWTRTFTNTQLSAVRLRLKWPSLFKQEDNGDLVGYSINYAIDLQTDGGTWQTVLNTSVTGKTTSGYERSHRIDLPQAGSTWTIRLRKITADANSAKIGDTMTLQSFTEVIDAKLRYPNTALLYIEFDSSQFNGSIPQISCEPKMRVIRVPDNYDPETRTYSGTWQGAFKWAWTDNPAWIFYDLVITERFGLGNRLSAANIDKWTLYQVSQYCDQPVPDGKGGSETEPRYTCNVYVQDRNDAYTVLRDFAAIFRGMTYWGGDQIVALADMPRDVDYAYTRANVIDGRFTYSSSTTKTRYTTALVSWSDPGNAYADAMEPVFEQPLVARYGFNQLEMTAIGCTRQSEANRKGRWGILTNNKDRVVSFDVGLDGNIPQPGYIIAVSDELLSGKVMGGRISAVNGRVIKLDRVADAAAGDRLILNLPSGASQSRTIQAVNGESVTVTTAYSETPQAEAVWVVESDELYAQQYRVVSVSDNDDGTFSITGAWHDPDKYTRIDTGAIIDQRPVSVIPPGNQSPPANIVINSFSVVQQNISVETMRVSWDQAQNAIAYEAQWRRNDGNWVNVPRSSTTSFDVPGIYAGRYLVRVRAINAAEISSGWGYSEEKTLTGKVGNPPKPVGFATTPINWGIRLNWGFPANTGDTLKTEIQYTANSDFSNPLLLSDVPYPSAEYTQLGLKAGQEFWYRAQLVDRTGNESGWTDWVRGVSNANADDYLGDIADDFLTYADGDRLTSDINTNLEAALQNALANHATVEHQWAQYGEVRADILVVKTTIADVDKAMAEMSTQVQAQFNNVTAALEDKLTAVVDATGASAIYTLKTGVRINGVMYNAGMSIAVLAEAGKPVVTRVGFNANQFVLMSGSGDTQYSPFAVVNGQVFISDAFIQDASITSAKIKDAAITNAKIGNVIQSNNWDGNNGWMIDKAGNATFNNTTVRGTVYATNGSFSGTIEAKHFVGDIVNAGVGADKIATGDNTVSATIQYTDTSESTTPKTAIVSAMCHMTGSRSDRDTSLGLRIEINGVVKEFGSTYIPPARDVFVPIHWALSGITSRVVTATITLFNNSGLEGAVQKKIIGPTLQIARGSGSFQSW